MASKLRKEVIDSPIPANPNGEEWVYTVEWEYRTYIDPDEVEESIIDISAYFERQAWRAFTRDMGLDNLVANIRELEHLAMEHAPIGGPYEAVLRLRETIGKKLSRIADVEL